MPARDERGVVTAETATVLPLLLAVTVGMAWLVSLGLAQMQVADAAREAARALARGEDAGLATRLAERVAPGSRTTLSEESGTVVVQVERRLGPPGGLLDGIAGATVRSEAVALVEDAE
jgi:Flp pilus assembly protein TadG